MLGVRASECWREAWGFRLFGLFSGAKNGRERPQKLFGRLKAEKVGSLPPVSVVQFPALLRVAMT